MRILSFSVLQTGSDSADTAVTISAEVGNGKYGRFTYRFPLKEDTGNPKTGFPALTRSERAELEYNLRTLYGYRTAFGTKIRVGNTYSVDSGCRYSQVAEEGSAV